MAKDRIKILGDWSAWADPVRQGQLVRPDGESVWILIRCRPELTYEDAQWKVEKANSRLISRIDHPSVLRLLHASKVGGAPAWIHEGFQGVSMSRVLDVLSSSGDYFSARAAIEAVERTVQGMRSALSQGRNLQGGEASLYHPGPAPSDLLIDSVGAIKLAGFDLESEDGPKLPTEPGYEPLQPGTPEQRGVYGLAALLVHLLGGEKPGVAGSDEGRQDAVIRRAVIRVLARPGEAVPDSIIDLIKAGLAFDPEERPEFTVMEDELARAAGELRSEALRAWAPTAVPGLLQMAEKGYPSSDSMRLRRHIDPIDDSSSYEVPPVRPRDTSSAPREVATVLAKVDVAAAVAAAEEEVSRENSGLVSQTSFGSIPTSETDVKVATAAVLAAERGEPAPVTLDIGEPDDTWELEPEPEGKMGGWPLIAGLVIGMIVAAIVGWVAVEHMVEQAPATAELQPLSPEVVPAPPPVPEPEAVPAEEEADAVVEEVSEEEAEADAEPEVEEAPEAEPMAAEDAPEPMTAEPPPAAPVAAPEAPPVAPTRPSPPAQAAAPSEPVPDVFAVTFRNASNTIERLVVRCHKGGVGEGAEVVHIAGAGKGPCRVEGYAGTEKIAVSAILMGPANFTCFEGDARVCR